MKKGDHIYIHCSYKVVQYTHHGIYCGNGMVIHYHKDKIRRTSKSKFSSGQKIYIEKYKKSAPVSVVVKRAKSRRGEQLYNLIFNNCEHFAYWCKTGKHKSKQVDEAAIKVLDKLDKKFKEEIKKIKKKIKYL